jgi:carboxymethylenebutenolidase
MAEREITVPTPEGDMTAFVVHPDGEGPWPVAVLYQDGIGYREQIKENARRFAADGYYVAAPDLFHRFGEKLSFSREDLDDPDTRQRLMETVWRTKPEQAEADTEALFAAIADDPAAAPGPKVCVGYCMGARFVVHMTSAMPDEYAAGAAIHPGALATDEPDSPHHELATVRGELYVSFSEHDQTATPENIERFREEAERQGVRGIVERVPGVHHGFAMADSPVYDRDAAERHFEKTLELWRRNLSGRPAALPS